MNAQTRRRVRMLTSVSDPTNVPAQPDFLTPVPTGLGEADKDVTEMGADRLRPADARRLTARLDDIAQARLRARAASRHTFVG